MISYRVESTLRGCVMATVNPTYKEFREDGWPYCPQCEEDELYSYLMLGWTKDEPPSVQDCIDAGMQCYRCNWKSHGRNIFGGKCWRCNLFFSRPTGEKDYVYCCERPCSDHLGRLCCLTLKINLTSLSSCFPFQPKFFCSPRKARQRGPK